MIGHGANPATLTAVNPSVPRSNHWPSVDGCAAAPDARTRAAMLAGSSWKRAIGIYSRRGMERSKPSLPQPQSSQAAANEQAKPLYRTFAKYDRRVEDHEEREAVPRAAQQLRPPREALRSAPPPKD